MAALDGEHHLGFHERAAAVVLAAGLSRRLGYLLREPQDVESGFRFVGFQSSWRTACYLLWRLELAEVQSDEHLCYRLTPPDEIRSLLGSQDYDFSWLLEDLLEAYLDLASSFGPPEECLPTTRVAFECPRASVSELRALARLGYLDMEQDLACWTDKAQDVMQKLYLWDSQGRDFAQLRIDKMDALALQLIAETPELLRKRLRNCALEASQVEFVGILRDEFDGLYWRTNPDGSIREKSDREANLPFLIYKILRAE